MKRFLTTVLSNPRIRGETGWVVAHKLSEFAVMFATLKLFTNLMPKDVYGEFSIALTSLLLLANLSAVPVTQAYYRKYHAAEADGTARDTLAQTIQWMLGITVAAAVLGSVLTLPLSRLLNIETLTALGVGLIFLGNRWRSFWIELLDVRRLRRICAIQNVGFFAAQCVFVSLAVKIFEPSATVALIAYAFAAATFGGIGWRGLIRLRDSLPLGEPAALRRMFVTFGVPLGALLTCQWVQMFAERYVVGIQLDKAALGNYVAAYQVCGIPFMLAYAIMNALVLPIAYQRAKDVKDPAQLRSANKVLLAATGAYLLFGGVMLGGYYLAGPTLLRMLTAEEYVLGRNTVLAIAAARYVVFLGMLLHTFFKVHQRVGALLGFSIAGAILIVPFSWYAVQWYGLIGAALGVLATGLIYNFLMIFFPGGCLTLLIAVRNPQPDPVAN